MSILVIRQMVVVTKRSTLSHSTTATKSVWRLTLGQHLKSTSLALLMVLVLDLLQTPLNKNPLPPFHKEPDYQELPLSEKEIVQKQIEVPEVAPGYWTLFRFAGPLEWAVFCWRCVCAVAAGAAMPLMTVRVETLLTKLIY
jgi:hypothetical protein